MFGSIGQIRSYRRVTRRSRHQTDTRSLNSSQSGASDQFCYIANRQGISTADRNRLTSLNRCHRQGCINSSMIAVAPIRIDKAHILHFAKHTCCPLVFFHFYLFRSRPWDLVLSGSVLACARRGEKAGIPARVGSLGRSKVFGQSPASIIATMAGHKRPRSPYISTSKKGKGDVSRCRPHQPDLKLGNPKYTSNAIITASCISSSAL